MPSDEIMRKFHEGTLHSGKDGKVVTNPSQAAAIYHSYKKAEAAMKGKKKGKGKR